MTYVKAAVVCLCLIVGGENRESGGIHQHLLPAGVTTREKETKTQDRTVPTTEGPGQLEEFGKGPGLEEISEWGAVRLSSVVAQWNK